MTLWLLLAACSSAPEPAAVAVTRAAPHTYEPPTPTLPTGRRKMALSVDPFTYDNLVLDLVDGQMEVVARQRGPGWSFFVGETVDDYRARTRTLSFWNDPRGGTANHDLTSALVVLGPPNARRDRPSPCSTTRPGPPTVNRIRSGDAHHRGPTDGSLAVEAEEAGGAVTLRLHVTDDEPQLLDEPAGSWQGADQVELRWRCRDEDRVVRVAWTADQPVLHWEFSLRSAPRPPSCRDDILRVPLTPDLLCVPSPDVWEIPFTATFVDADRSGTTTIATSDLVPGERPTFGVLVRNRGLATLPTANWLEAGDSPTGQVPTAP